MNKINKDINLFVSCNKQTYIPNVKYLIPIHVGKSISNENLGFIGDNTGDNISNLNKYFCELTAQYWAWKNVDCDYYGFMHYRRFFSFAKPILNNNYIQSDLFLESINPKTVKLINLNNRYIKEIVNKYDVILPIPMRLNKLDVNNNTIYKHYKESPHHDISDLKLCKKIILKKYPNFEKYVNRGFNSHKCSFLNMFIMRKDVFKEYSKWLFSILLEFHKTKDYSNSSYYSIRTPGLLGERLLNIYILYLKDNFKKIKIGYLQNTFFEDTSNPFLLPMLKDKNAICFATDNVYIKHLSVALISLAMNTKSKLEVIVLDDHISFSNKERIINQMIKYKNIILRFIKVGDYLRADLYEKYHIKKSAYARFAIFDLLKEYKKILYLDSDLIVNDDITELLSTSLDEFYAGVVRDSAMGSWMSQFQSYGKIQRNYNNKILKLTNIRNYFNSGVMLLNVPKIINDNITTDYLIKIALRREWNWQDQDVLNYVFREKLVFLDRKWNFLAHEIQKESLSLEYDLPIKEFDEYKLSKDNPSIIHFAGHNEPIYCWNVIYSDIYWNYAKRSNFYIELLNETKIFIDQNLIIRKHSKFYLLMVKIIPKKSLTYKIFRSIYHFFIG